MYTYIIWLNVYIPNPGLELTYHWHTHTLIHTLMKIIKVWQQGRSKHRGKVFKAMANIEPTTKAWIYCYLSSRENTSSFCAICSSLGVMWFCWREAVFKPQKHMRAHNKWNETSQTSCPGATHTSSTCSICNLYQALTFVPQVLPTGMI